MIKKHIKKIIFYLLFIIIILLIREGIKAFKNINKKSKIIEITENIHKNLDNIENFLNTNHNSLSNKFDKDNELLINYLINDNFIISNDEIETNDKMISINIGSNILVREFPTNETDMSNTIIMLQNTINKMNKYRIEDKEMVSYVITNTILEIQDVKTNIIYLKEEIKKITKPKYLSYAIGLGFSYNGKSSTGVTLYDITLHGTIFFIEKTYINLGIGYAYNLQYSPKISLEIGYKFN